MKSEIKQMAQTGTRPLPVDCQTPHRQHWLDEIQQSFTPMRRSRTTEERIDQEFEAAWADAKRLGRQVVGWAVIIFAALFIAWGLWEGLR